MITSRHALVALLAVGLVVIAVSCGDNNPSSSSGPILTLSRGNLEFIARAGSSADPAQLKVTVKLNGASVTDFDYRKTAAWLEVATYGTDTLFVTVRAETLGAGEHRDTIWVDAADAQNGPVPLPVLLNVSDWIWTLPPNLQFSGLVGGANPPAQRLDLNVYAGSSGTYVASTSSPWITISSTVGNLPDSIEIGVDVSGLANGQYSGSIVFSSPELPDANYVLDCELNVSSWAAHTLPDQIGQLSNYEGLSLLGTQLGWVVGWFPGGVEQRSVIYHTADGGQTWQGIGELLNSRLGGVSFVDEQHGWAVGREATMFATSDGGTHWDRIVNLPVGTGVDLRVVKFLSEDTGWVVGTAGTVLRTYDGGANWTLKTPTSFDLTDICILDKNRIWLSGNHGVLLATSNGGDTWGLLNTETIKDLRSVHYTDATHGWAVGVSGTVLKTTNGGATWTSEDCGFTTSLHDVWFANDERGWIVGLEGLILRSDDGGVTWVQQLSGTDIGLYEVEFADENFGMVVGEAGTLLRTANGGF